MADKNFKAIEDALDLLAKGTANKTNGKITCINLAKQAGVSKATVYRYFETHLDLKESFEALRKNGIKLSDDSPETLEQAYALLKEEVKALRSELADVKSKAWKKDKLKSHQIQLLWMENERLLGEIRRLCGNDDTNNVSTLPLTRDSVDRDTDAISNGETCYGENMVRRKGECDNDEP